MHFDWNIQIRNDRVYVCTYPYSELSIYVRLTFPLQSNIDIPRNSFRAGAVVQYNGFLRMCEGTTVTHHGYVSLSLIYITSESSIFIGFHTILWSKLNIKFRLQISLVLNLLGVISVTSAASLHGIYSTLLSPTVSTPRYSAPTKRESTPCYSVPLQSRSTPHYSVPPETEIYSTLLSPPQSGIFSTLLSLLHRVVSTTRYSVPPQCGIYSTLLSSIQRVNLLHVTQSY